MRRTAAVLIAVSCVVATSAAHGQTPAGGQLLYSTVKVPAGQIVTWTVTCPRGMVAVAAWPGVPPSKITVTQRIVAGPAAAMTFRAVSRNSADQQVTVAVTCVRPAITVSMAAGKKKKVKLKLDFSVSPAVKTTVPAGGAQTVKLACPKRAQALSVGTDVAPVASPRAGFPTVKTDVPFVVDVVSSDRLARASVRNPDDVARTLTAVAHCVQARDRNDTPVLLRGLRTAARVDVAAGTQAVRRLSCPSRTVPLGVEWDDTGADPIATALFPQGRSVVDLLAAAPRRGGFVRATARCLPLPRFQVDGMPPAPFTGGVLADEPTPGTGPLATPPPATTQPATAVGSGTFSDVPGFPSERAFSLVFTRSGTGLRVRTPGHTVTNFLAPAGMSCTMGGEQLDCAGAVTPGAAYTGRIALLPAAAVGDQAEISLLADQSPPDPFTLPLVP